MQDNILMVGTAGEMKYRRCSMTREEQQMRKRELEWRAEDDARIMAQYQDIMKDKARMDRAVKVARKQAKDLQERANTMKRVAKTNKKNDKKK